MVEIRQEIVRHPTKNKDGTPRFPGRFVAVWMKVPFMPWMLYSLSPFDGDADA